MIESKAIILGKSDVGVLDRGPIDSSTDSSNSHIEPRDYNPNNGSSIQDSCVVSVEDDKRIVRKAQALKANLAKRKKQQRARSTKNPFS